ncbi:proline/glycine betaine ABC transporter permease [Dysgonomonas mossii]|uniref:Proline/glycine betaine ABC transporter permease n=1 Tax=Dysgonomonas mossii TaxID=163665 RepID=A0A4Y9ILX0_9BACT|nr:proline/glycine betaine ABC transporter permease [Dysgonomonas mossii]MBF0761877.1 proline/glycine betaine ABC transporter permease [Dysgonomonas mossii]TFU88705.1 proline/glycine betaine ABC transporter permease [Dysgonomonas mossii]
MNKLDIGKYIERFVDWLSDTAAPLFRQITIMIDNSVDVLQELLGYVPFYMIIAIVALIAFIIKKKSLGNHKSWQNNIATLIGFPLFCVLGLLLIYWMGFWEQTMDTFILVLVATLIVLMIGIPLGIWCAYNKKAYAIIRPLLDFMQTMPAFVYLIPAILFFSVGNVPGVLATVIFSLPPAVRMTALGIKSVPKEVVEASVAFGCTRRQTLFKVQMPLAMTTILAGINQVIMLSLSMVVIASMVGAGGLGESVYAGIQQADVALGFEAGFCIVILAIILDRMTQLLGKEKEEQK